MASTQQTVTRKRTARQQVGIFISHGHFSPVSLSEEEALGRLCFRYCGGLRRGGRQAEYIDTLPSKRAENIDTFCFKADGGWWAASY